MARQPSLVAVVQSITLFGIRTSALQTRDKTHAVQASLADDHSKLEPPDPIPNSEVKRLSADGSVGLPHVRVGHRQPLNTVERPQKPLQASLQGFLLLVQAAVFECV